jgi:uracil-DNA glycosylase family 4
MTPEKFARAIVQRLESLQRAGLTHVKKGSKRSLPPRLEASALKAPAGKTFQPLPVAEVAEKVETPKDERADERAAALAVVACRVAVCTRCEELARTRTQTVFGVGNPYARLVFCGEAPGADEDRLGEPFVGRAGQLLTDIIVKGMKIRREDVYILNILRCRPPGNRNPLPVEAANCREYLDSQLAIIRPEFICCLGAVAAQNLLGATAAIGSLRGRVHDFHGIKVVCTYHPAYLLRNPSAKRFVWDDIKVLMAEMEK